MCEERKKAERKRRMAMAFELARIAAKTDFELGHKHPDFCVKADLINLMAEDREETLREQAIDHEEKAKKIEAIGLEKILNALSDNKPLMYAVLILIFGDKILPLLLKLTP